MSDTFRNYSGSLSSPAGSAFAITPSDSEDLSVYTRGIYVGGAGNVKLTTVGGDTITLNGCLAGTVLPIRAKRVFSTGTTATNLLAMHGARGVADTVVTAFIRRVVSSGGTVYITSQTQDVYDAVKGYEPSLLSACNAGKAGVLYNIIPE